jgi:hypothetical protein
MKVLSIVIILCITQIPLLLCAQNPEKSYQILSAAELSELESMLTEAELLPEHTKFYRDWDPSTRLKSDWHMSILEGGLDAPQQMSELRRLMAEGNPAEQLGHFFHIAAGVEDAGAYERTQLLSSGAAQRIRKPKDIFRYLDTAFGELQTGYDAAFALLNESQADTLMAFCLQTMIEAEDSTAYKQYFREQQLAWIEDFDLERIADLLELIDLEALKRTAVEYLLWTDTLREVLPRL